MFFNKHNGAKAPLLFLFVLLVLLPFTTATRVTTNPAQGLQINTWEVGTAQQNQPYNFVWDVSDSYGQLLNNTEINCIFFLQKAGTTIPLASGNSSKPPGDSKSWYKLVPASAFTQLGNYNYQIDCYRVSNVSVSGSVLSVFTITTDGEPINTGTKTFIIMFLLSVVILVLGFIFTNHIFSFISGLSFLVTGSYSMIYGFATNLSQYSRMVSVIIIGLGAIITLISALELIKETSGGDGDNNNQEEGDDD